MKQHNPIGKRRLEKMAAFMDKLPPERFNFGVVYETPMAGQPEFPTLRTKSCGAAACVIGWAPRVFPRLVRYSKRSTALEIYRDGEWLAASFEDAGAHIFKMTWSDSERLFSPRMQHYLGLKDVHAGGTPKQAAEMIRSYIKKHIE